MEASGNKQRIGWGMLLIVFGITAFLDNFVGLTDWMTVGVIALGGLAALVVFLTDRQDWRLLIPPYIMLAVAGIAALGISNLLEGEILASTVLLLVAIPFLVVFLLNRGNWWALIPSWVLLSISLMIFLLDQNILSGGIVPLFVLSSIGLPFLVVYLLNRENWWALIPAYIMFDVGIMVALIDARLLNDLAIPAYVMFSIALPFFFVYLINRKNWWALIPGGITAVIGLGFFAGTDLAKYVIPAVLLIAGIWVLSRSFTKKE